MRTDRSLSRAAAGGRAVVDVTAPRAAQAEEYFHQSIGIARQQQAKSWELRAVMSLARLYQDQNKRTEAHGLLERIYNNFTEGFATADLQEAKALLDELSRAGADGRITAAEQRQS